RVIALQRSEEADDALLHQLEPGDRLGPAVDARDPGDQRQECLDDLLPSAAVAEPGGIDEPPLDRGREPGTVAEVAQVAGGARRASRTAVTQCRRQVPIQPPCRPRLRV